MNSTTYFKNQRFNKIKEQLIEQKSLFVDNVFPATTAALGGAVESLTEDQHIEWKRPRDICDEPRLIPDGGSGGAAGPFSLEITGGKLVSFWFLQALQILAGIRELLFKVIVNCSEQELSSENYVGIFRFRFWRFGQWVEVVVDDTLPTLDSRLLFTNFSPPALFWPCLLEKAYAKLLGSYGALEDGHMCDALVDLTGGVTQVMDLKACDVATSEDDRANLFRTLSSEMSQHSIICASIPVEKDNSNSKTPEGLAKGRTYHVTALKKIHIQDIKLRNLFKGREKLAVIRIRDTCLGICDPLSLESSPVNSPTASSPTLSLADSSPEDDASPSTPHVTNVKSRKAAWSRLRNKDHSRLGLTLEAEGEFWLPFEDFCRSFHELIIVRLFNHNLFTRGPTWLDSAFHGAWIAAERSGGGNTNSSGFFQNPQFLIDIKEDDEPVVMQLLQEGGVEPSSAGSAVAPHKFLAIGLVIFQAEANRKHRLHRQWGFTPKTATVEHARRRELTYRGSLDRGRYILIPSAFRPGSQGSFLLRIISQNNVKLRPIKRDIPHEPCGLSCIASPVLWVTVLTVKTAAGLPDAKDIVCTVTCEKESARTAIFRCVKGEATWRDSFVFYRRKPERPIVVSVYAHNTIKRNELLGMIALQACVNHAPSSLEVTLVDKQGDVIPDRTLVLDILTEDDLMSV